MEGAMPNTPLDREEDKKEIFARVWKRVMGDHTDACPITWEETGGDQAQTTTEQQQTLVTEEAAQTEEKTVLPAPHVPRGGQRLHSDFPRDDAQGVLGPQCLDCAPLLQELIRRELADCREYQTLSRRAGGGPPGCWRGWLERRSAGPSDSRRPIFSSPGCATGRRGRSARR